MSCCPCARTAPLRTSTTSSLASAGVGDRTSGPILGASSLGSDARRGLEDHPTVKPTAMLEDGLLDLTDRGDTVIDPFLGSGSTLIAAEKTGRICRGVELDPLYVDVIVRRFEAATGISATLVETGETFPALAVRREREAAELTVEPASP